ncbi:hypothetical protein ASD00_33815 [Ensifer sp. Root31]|uniref:hypothetical protein n=1 Tax=Ensifer sp. Root31 TaxID=1736512 RepID=UPI00070CDA29|nr:hypothetical protein [Ensifer sp. Root31]KQU83879.1 hypothetical protein ASD00_33815 [Ensifer sp. Root31]
MNLRLKYAGRRALLALLLATAMPAGAESVICYTPDATTAASALQLNETNMLDSPPMDLLPVLQVTPDLRIRSLGPLRQMAFLRFNSVQPPFGKTEVHKAETHLIDQKAGMSVVGGTDVAYLAAENLRVALLGKFSSLMAFNKAPTGALDTPLSVLRNVAA